MWHEPMTDKQARYIGALMVDAGWPAKFSSRVHNDTTRAEASDIIDDLLAEQIEPRPDNVIRLFG